MRALYWLATLPTVCLLLLLLMTASAADPHLLVSVNSAGTAANATSWPTGLSSDGRYAAFESLGTNLVPGDTNGVRDVFVHDTQTGVTERVSIASDGTQGNAESTDSVLSADGRFVAFRSAANNLAPGLEGTGERVFVRDRVAGTTELVSAGFQYAWKPAISADGRYVAFVGLNGSFQVFVRDRQIGTTEQVSLAPNGSPADYHASYTGYIVAPAISADGRYVAFVSMAKNLAPGDPYDYADIFVRDRVAGTTELVSQSWNGSFANWSSIQPQMSADGRYVAFSSSASNLIPIDTNNNHDVFVRDRQAGLTERVSISDLESQSNGYSGAPTISGDGRFVGLYSDATNLVQPPFPGYQGYYLRDRAAGTTVSTNIMGLVDMNQDGQYLLYGSGVAVRWDRSAPVPPSTPTPTPPGPSIDTISIDVEEEGTPANTSTSIGSIETCRRLNNNNLLDADEDSIDSIAIDFVVGPIGVPAERPAIAFSMSLDYDMSKLRVNSNNVNHFLAVNPGSTILDVSDSIPDNDWPYSSVAVDTSLDPGESGPGVLSRLVLEAVNSSPWLTALGLTGSGVIDGNALLIPVATVNGARLALDAACTDPDGDGDGAPDYADNCPTVYNYDQFNHDNDPMGDLCDLDDDNAGVPDLDEIACGGDPIVAALRPERIDGTYAGVDDDGDGAIDEPLPAGASAFDCDGDGYSGVVEDHVFGAAARGNQNACGTNGWPSDFVSGGIPDSTNRITVGDLTSFLAPVRRLGTSPGDAGFNQRWDLAPGKGVFSSDVSISDLTSLLAGPGGFPPMLHGAKAFGGPSCP